MKQRALEIIFVFSILSFVSCKDFVTVGPPSNQLASSTVFQTEQTAVAAINGLYSILSNTSLSFSAGGQSVYLGTYTDELTYTSTSANDLEFANSKLSEANSIVYSNFWRYPYQTIYQANSCIQGLEAAAIPADTKKQLLGESYFIRAYCYWQLSVLFGDVPLVLDSKDYQNNSQMFRKPIAQVQAQVLADLALAKSLLKPAYPTAGRYRANHYTVMALLSRIHTYLGNWTDALNASNEVLSQTSTYSLETDLNRTFLIGSSEAIWQTATANATQNSYEGFAFIPSTSATSRPNYPLSQQLFAAFTALDKRKTIWTATKTVAGITYQYPYKYKVQTNAVKTEAQMMIRLGEIFLNRAEAKSHLNDPSAIDDLNKIRSRAGLMNLSGLSGQPLIDAIMQERRLELFAEWGLRFYDLKRTGQLNTVLTPLKSQWLATGTLFPIPATEILAAPNLVQNPGYN